MQNFPHLAVVTVHAVYHLSFRWEFLHIFRRQTFLVLLLYKHFWNCFNVLHAKKSRFFLLFFLRFCRCFFVWRKNLQEVLRVEQLLLQIEQQELKRQRENLIMRKNLARRELDEGVKMLMTNTSASVSLQNLSDVSSAMTNGNSHYENVNNHHHHHVHSNHQQPTAYQINDYRKSMPNLQDFSNGWLQIDSRSTYQPSPASSSFQYPGDLTTPSSKSEIHLNHNNLVPKPYQPPAPPTHHHHNSNSNVYGNMTRHALMQISAVPKPKLTNDWVQFRKSEPAKPSINSHWLIQEAEQRRIDQLNNSRTNGVNNSKKPLPESIIQSLTQRVQHMGLGVNVNKRWFD